MATGYTLGLFSWYGYRTSVRSSLRKIKAFGFDSTMLWWGDELAFEELNKKELINEAHKNGLMVENIHTPFQDINWIWEENSNERKVLVNKFKGWINDCAEFNVPIMLMHISRGDNRIEPNRAGLISLNQIVEEAEKLGVKVAIENTRQPHLMEYLLENIGSSYLGVCYDTSHGQLYDREPFETLKRYADRLICLHLSDNDGKEDSHWCVGDGVIDWEAFIDAFPKSTYKGIFSFEVYPENPDIPEDLFLQKAYESANRLLEKIGR